MKLEDIALQVRLRNPWEATDLGLRMIQRWWRAILLPWLLIVGSIILVLVLLLPADDWLLVGVILWWLKPMLDRPVLYVLSRASFDATPGTWQTLRALPGLWWSDGAFAGLLRSLTIGRFDLARSMNLPVAQLEGLRGKAASARRRVLGQQTTQYAVGLSVVWLHIESMLTLTVYGLLLAMVPHEQLAAAFDWMVLDEGPLAEGLGFMIYALAMTIAEPIYVASGFALYLNRRTQLEAWDLELSFRRMAQRVENKQGASASMLASWLPVVVLAGAFVGLAVLPTGSIAASGAETGATSAATSGGGVNLSRQLETDYQRRIREIMDSPEMRHKKTRTEWRLKDFETDKDSIDLDWSFGVWGLSFNGLFGYLLLGTALLIALVLLWSKREALRELVGQWRGGDRDAPPKPAETLFGLDVRPESLPEDIPAEVMALWQAGRHREAMSLLYRAALSRLIHHYPIRLNASATEGEVLHQAQRLLGRGDSHWMRELTQNWQALAYAHRRPDGELVARLCRDWWQWAGNDQASDHGPGDGTDQYGSARQ